MGDAPSCDNCRFYLESLSPHETNMGKCRRSPPTPMDPRYARSDWPLVRYTDWCGEHAPIILVNPHADR